MHPRIVLFVAMFLVAISCDDPMKMFPDHQVGDPRILALKVSEPELTPDAQPTMRLLIGGEGFDQASGLSVLWLVPDDEKMRADIPSELLPLLRAPYASDFSLPSGMTVGTLLSFSPELQNTFTMQGFVDLPVFASVVIGDKPLSIMKKIRITHEPRHRNPEITGITAVWKNAAGDLVQKPLGRDDILELMQEEIPGYLGLAPETADPAAGGNDLLVFRWQFSEDPSYRTDLRFCDATCPSEEYLGVDRVTPATREIMIDFTKTHKRLSHTPPEHDVALMFYLVVRDRAAQATSSADDRYGLDFTTMKLVLKKP